MKDWRLESDFSFLISEGEKKTPFTHPYSYDPFDIFNINQEANDTIYTDRLLMWDYNKHNRLCKKHFGNEGQYWNKRNPKLIEAFLRDWTEDQELILTKITQYCNLSNGYPVWRLDFKRKGG